MCVKSPDGLIVRGGRSVSRLIFVYPPLPHFPETLQCQFPPLKTARGKHFTVFPSADEEAATRRAQRSSDHGSGHMSSERGRIVHMPGLDLPYRAILTHDAGADTEHDFATMQEAEAFIKRNTPVPAPRRTTYDRDASAPVEHGD